MNSTILKSIGLTATIAALLLTGCGQPAPGGATHHAPDSGRPAPDFPTNVVAYEVKGVLKEIRAAGWKALIAHEDIPGYMEAMTMLLDVKATNELSGLRPGDAIAFRMLVTDTDGWIDRVKKIGSALAGAATNASPEGEGIFEELEPGAPVPDCLLTNQLGQAFRLSDLKGRAFAFTFIFTRCPFPVYCPRMNNNFAAVQKELARPGVGTNWQLLSISFDPEFDTPARLAKYAEGYHHDPAHWTFATGATEDVRRLGSSFSLAFWREGALFNHNVRTVVVDPRGRVHKLFPGNEWKAEEVVEALKKAMAVQP